MEPRAYGILILKPDAKRRLTKLSITHSFKNKIEYDDVLSACEVLEEWYASDFFTLLRYNYGGFLEEYERIREEAVKTPYFGDFTKIRIKLNNILISFLTMMRLYLDATETRLKRLRSPKREMECQVFETARHREYDSVFAYRFTYHLRNYAQHCNLPLTQINVGSNLSEATGVRTFTFSASFDVKKLLNDYKKWKEVKQDLQNMQDDVALMQTVSDAMSSLQRIEQQVLIASGRRLHESVGKLQKILKHTTVLQGKPFLFASPSLSSMREHTEKAMRGEVEPSQAMVANFNLRPIDSISALIDEFLGCNKPLLLEYHAE